MQRSQLGLACCRRIVNSGEGTVAQVDVLDYTVNFEGNQNISIRLKENLTLSAQKESRSHVSLNFFESLLNRCRLRL